ncbi:redoxin domain-containing protein [Janibacter melonis]|uniref:redoxin domain-containing protein n=1 Tax=Janibacter melonis TaxID=262209 RepID=UPI00355663CB
MTLAGQTLQGASWSIGDHAGSVVVVNSWVSWCGPCHEEAPDLVRAHGELAAGKDPVRFIGIDYRESSRDRPVAGRGGVCPTTRSSTTQGSPPCR